MNLTKRELDTVLAALRHWQKTEVVDESLYAIASNLGSCEPLNDDEIDALCERLNTESP